MILKNKGVCIENNTILLVKKESIWVLPNIYSKIGKSNLSSLDNCFDDKFLDKTFQIFDRYREFYVFDQSKKDDVLCKSYFVRFLGNLNQKPINENLKFFSIKEFEEVEMSLITLKLIKYLINDFYLET